MSGPDGELPPVALEPDTLPDPPLTAERASALISKEIA